MNMAASSEKQSSLASLLGEGNATALWNDSDLGAILRHQLGTPVDRNDGRTFEEILLDPAADVERLGRSRTLPKVGEKIGNRGFRGICVMSFITRRLRLDGCGA